MEFNARKYAEKMRNSKNLDNNGNVICSLEQWERIATMLEEQDDEKEDNEASAKSDPPAAVSSILLHWSASHSLLRAVQSCSYRQFRQCPHRSASGTS